MRLYHSTDEAGMLGIETEGFARSDNRDSQGCTWLSIDKTSAQLGSRTGWWVIVDLPDDLVEEHEVAPGSDYRGPYKVAWDVLNAHQPFIFEQA